jgi:pilus biogenesis lipoprotein CpaD
METERGNSTAAGGLLVKTACLILCITLSACSGSGYVPKKPGVAFQERAHAVAFNSDGRTIKAGDRAAMEQFFADVQPLAVQRVRIVSATGDAPGLANAQGMRSWLIGKGFPPRVIEIAQGPHAAGQLYVTLDYAVALPPEGCPNWSDGDLTNISNKTQANFGCADATNLARQVADPADLVRGHGGATWDGDRNGVAVMKYKTDQVTQTVKDSASSSGGGQ